MVKIEEELPSTFQTNLNYSFTKLFDYPESTNDCIEWHLNLHTLIFLLLMEVKFAQDEMQV